MDWHQIKVAMSATSGLGMDALHVHAGVLIHIGAAMILRRRLSQLLPWIVVLGFVLANEAYDYTYEVWPDREMQRAEAFSDSWNTLLLPTILLLAVKFAPGLFAKHPPPEVASAADPG